MPMFISENYVDGSSGTEDNYVDVPQTMTALTICYGGGERMLILQTSKKGHFKLKYTGFNHYHYHFKVEYTGCN